MTKTNGLHSYTHNETMLEMVAKIAISTVNKLASDKSDILHNPATIDELEANTTMVANIVSLKLKNSLIKN